MMIETIVLGVLTLPAALPPLDSVPALAIVAPDETGTIRLTGVCGAQDTIYTIQIVEADWELWRTTMSVVVDDRCSGPNDALIELGPEPDRVFGGDGFDTVKAGCGRDVVSLGAGEDLAYLGCDSDLGRGGPGDDHIDGGRGADRIWGDGGDDRLFGSKGADYVSGGQGADFIDGGKGIDRCRGGAGPDHFVNCETILDFDPTEDVDFGIIDQ